MDTFPILNARKFGLPVTIPMSLITPHAVRIGLNHGGQTVERIAERGGLSPREIYAAINDLRLSESLKISEKEAVIFILSLLGETK